MDGQHLPRREQARPAYHRTASRSSTSTRMTSHSGHSTASHNSSSSQPHSVQPTYRYPHIPGGNPPGSPRAASRTGPQLSRKGSIESARQTPVSAYLQERLQKERQAESQKLANTPTTPKLNDASSIYSDLASASQKSPPKNPGYELSRPQSSNSIDPAQKKGLALKEMEQVISGLHKQNFDLKLELYHRREKQSRLEERLEALESEKIQVGSVNDRLLSELEQRDRAIEESVAMIVMLESRVDQLTEERSMVRQVESESFFGSPKAGPAPAGTPQPPSMLELGAPNGDVPSLNRMPSFLSDRSDKTENLRNVYLGARGSVVSLPRVREGPDSDTGPSNELASPTLSMLSESSFLSIYGQKDQPIMDSSRIEPMSLEGNAKVTDTQTEQLQQIPGSETPRQTTRSSSLARINNAGQFQPMSNILQDSPLQRIERLDPSSPSKHDVPRSSSSADLAKATRSPRRQSAKDEKREALRKVMTDAAGGVSLHEPALPPTPDTVTSSTLRRFKNSNDTLDRRLNSTEGQSQDSLWRLRQSQEKLPSHPSASVEAPVVRPSREPEPELGSRHEYGQYPVQRPRSADESTVSNRRGRGWDMDDDSDTDSLDSSLDIWLRAGSKPPPRGRTSPDLFGFPTSPAQGSWAMNAMFGPGNTYNGGASIQPNSEQMNDLFSAQDALFGTAPPPQPERRSSLKAQTSSSHQPSADATPKPSAKGKSVKPAGRRGRHFRRNSDDAQARAGMKTPVPGQFSQPPPPKTQNGGQQKRSHYPPIAGHQGGRNGFSRLFRRSLGGSVPANSTSEGDQQPASTERDTAESHGGAKQHAAPLTAVRSNGMEEDRSGATPPPILRDPRRARGESLQESKNQMPLTPSGEGNTPETPVAAAANRTMPVQPSQVEEETPPHAQQQAEGNPAAGSATGSRRKWLPTFGRTGSLRNKTG